TLVVVLSAVGCSRGREEAALATATAREGEFAVTVSGRGRLDPLVEKEIMAQASGRVLKMTPEGASVQKDDVLIVLDSDYVQDQVIQERCNLEVEQATLIQREVYGTRRVNAAKKRIERSQALLEVAKSELTNAKAGLTIEDSSKITASSDVKATQVTATESARKLSVVKELRDLGVEKDVEVERQQTQKELAAVGHQRAGIVYKDVMDGLTPEEIQQLELQVDLAEHRVRAAQKDLTAAERSRKISVDSQQRQISRVRSTLNRAERELAATTIRAPADGIVCYKSLFGRKVMVGQWSFRSRPMVSLPLLDQMKLVLLVDEADIAKVRKEQAASISSASAPGAAFRGHVVRVGSLVKDVEQDLEDFQRKRLPHSKRRVFEVEIAVDDKDDRLRPGLSAEARIEVQRLDKVVLVPCNALRQKGDERLVLVWDGDKGQERAVQVLAENEYEAAIGRGLAAGEKVLFGGS
ncbi:MAG: hypothetical protein FJ278_00680, partial [Planctomycetes bacterium]|nr:hypothetical protein [Planctomycetota bacterium]